MLYVYFFIAEDRAKRDIDECVFCPNIFFLENTHKNYMENKILGGLKPFYN